MPFWTLFAIFAVATVALILLRPNPRQEARKPRSLKDVNFPRASESDPVPLILGTVRMDAPNTIWWGDFGTDAGRVQPGDRHFTNGSRYYMGWDMALGLGPDCQLKAIYLDKKIAWDAHVTTGAGETLNISVSLGGNRNGGYFRGRAHFYSGSYDQEIDEYLTQRIDPSDCVPAYNGVAHIVFEYFEVGESPQLRQMWFIMQCLPHSFADYWNAIPSNERPSGWSSISDPEAWSRIGDDVNPAEALWQVLTHPWRGLSMDPEDIDASSVYEIGQAMNSETLGISLQILSESKAEEIIQEIINTINGISYQDIETGKISFSLIRQNDASKASFVQNDVMVDGLIEFSRSSWSETFNQVKITHPQLSSESEAVAVDQDMGSIGINGVRSTTLSFPMVHDPAVAQRIAARELAEISVPLHKINIELQRNAVIDEDIRPGDIVTITYDPVDEDLGQWSLFEARFRVLEYDFGKLTDGKIILKCLQDSFAYELDFITEQSMPALPIVQPDPLPVTQRLLVRVPNYFTSNGNDMDFFAFAVSPGENWDRYDYEHRIGDEENFTTGLTNVIFDQLIILASNFNPVDEIPVSAFSHVVFPRASSITDFMNRSNPVGVLTNGREFIGVTDDRVYRGLYGASKLFINEYNNGNKFYYVDLSKRVSIGHDDSRSITAESRFTSYFSGAQHQGFFNPESIIFDRKFLAPQRLRWSRETLTWRIPDPRSTAWIDDDTPDHVFTETWTNPNSIIVTIQRFDGSSIRFQRLPPTARRFTFSNIPAGQYIANVQISDNDFFGFVSNSIPITVT